jgi:surface protein
MATSTPLAYNTGSTITGTQQIGNLSIATATTVNYDPNTNGGITFWMGPDEELGYIVGIPVSIGNQPTPISGVTAFLGFIRSSALTESSFLLMVNPTFGQNFTSGASAKTWLNSNGYWTSYDLPTSFISTWDSTIAGTSGVGKVALPLESSGTYAFSVDWGDGTSSYITAYNQAEVTHTYTTPVTNHVITIVGTISGFRFANGGDRLKFKSVTRWGSLRLGNNSGYFQGCANLTLTSVVDLLNLTNTTNCERMFDECYSITTVNRMNEWDVSNVTNMGLMFSNTTSFNQNLSDWNVGNVTIMYFMFNNSLFNNGGNSGINNWNTSKVTTIWYMFRYAYFNQPIGNWNMSNCTDMEGAFTAAWNFNQYIGDWNTSKVTRMSLMFASDGVNNNLPYNQNMGNWNISAVTTFTNFMFGKSSANFSPNNFSNTLCGWANTAPSNLSINFGSARYCNTGSTCYNTLDITKAWTISSGGSTATCT